ncbi:MAG TPA: hypothetical protein PK819_14690, partial [Thermomicrobiales bacterium]|nr:hypothetical protein [Thermomicrobiales bacterium]
DTNTTAIIVQGLVSVGEGDADMVHDALNYLTDAQLANGFSFQPGSGAIADANSTGIVVQALISAGEDPGAVKWQNVTGALSAFQLPDGSYSYMLDPLESNLFASVQALPAAAGQAFPIRAPGATNLTSLPTCTPAELESATHEAELACAA